MIEKERMTLLGDPLAFGFGSKLKAFGLRTDVQTTLLSFSFMLATSLVCAPQASPAAVLKLSCLTGASAGLGATLMRAGELCLAAFLAVEKTPMSPSGQRKVAPVVITMNPSDHFTRERLLWQSNAKTLKVGVTAIFATMCATTALVSSWEASPLLTASALASLLPAAARFDEGWRRWTNMYRGTWCAESPCLCLNKPKAAPLPSLKP